MNPVQERVRERQKQGKKESKQEGEPLYRLNYELGDWGSIPGTGKYILSFAAASRPPLWPPQPLIRWVPKVLALFYREKRPGREAYQSPPFSVEFKMRTDVTPRTLLGIEPSP